MGLDTKIGHGYTIHGIHGFDFPTLRQLQVSRERGQEEERWRRAPGRVTIAPEDRYDCPRSRRDLGRKLRY